MRIGTTPTHTFTIPSEIVRTASKVRVIYSQNRDVVLTKDVTEFSGDTVEVTLTQEETLKFQKQKVVDIQLRVLLTDGSALTSDIISVRAYECLENEVLV